MKSLACLLGQHDFLRVYSPGWLRLRCQACGRETSGLRGPISHALAPVVKVRKRRPPKLVPLRVVKARKTA